MFFNSLKFIFLFLPIFIIVYYSVPIKYKNIILLIGSLYFYAVGEPKYFILILLSILINFFIAKLMKLEKENWRRKLVLGCGLFYNFGMLLLFKYSVFIMDTILNIEKKLSITTFFPKDWNPMLKATLPLGISFYTFQITSYLIDVYRGKIKAENNILKLGTYLCMFPQVVSGPIVRYSDIKREMEERNFSIVRIEEGLKLFILGLGSKMLIANSMGSLWNQLQVIGFESVSTPLAWFGAFAFSLQIYFDFNGYSLMAVGIGKMLGFHLPRNFAHPYLAKSVTEFWRRWHISLGAWFREYIYIPLGGSRRGMGITIRNLFFVWMLTGLWHGAGWNFLLWGFYFFVLIVMEKLFLLTWLHKNKIVAHIYMLIIIPVSWIIFAISNVSELVIYGKKLFPFFENNNKLIIGYHDFTTQFITYGSIFFLGLFLCTSLPFKWYQKNKNKWIGLLVLLVIFWMSVYQITISNNNPFLYFKF